MQSIESLELDRLIIHGFNNLSDKSELAEKEEVMSEGLRHFFEEHIRNCCNSASSKTAKFNDSETTLSVCAATIISSPESFVEQSNVIGLWFGHQMEKTTQLQTFLAIGLFTDIDTDNRYIAILKLDPVKAFVKKGAPSFEQIQILPDPARQLLKYAIIRPYSDENRFDVIYRNQLAGKDEDPEIPAMWLEGFLEASDVATPRALTRLVVKETEKWIQSNDDLLEEEEITGLRNAVKITAQTEEMDVEAIAEATIRDEEVRGEYISRLLDKGLTETTFQPDREWAERSTRKTTYVCDDGVKITGASDVIDHVVQVMPKGDDRRTRVVIETKKFEQR